MPKKIFYLLSVSLIIFSFIFTITATFAASPSPSPSPSPTASPSASPPPSGSPSSPSGASGGTINLADISPVGAATAPEIIGNVIKAVLGIIGAFALFMFVYGGILMLTSAGNQEKIKKGKDVLIWAIIGLMVILGSYVLVSFVITGLKGDA